MICIYREKIYKCGDYMEVNIYPCFRKSTQRNRKAKPSSELQKKLNEKNAKNKLVRLLNNNFTKKDIAFDVSYDDEHHPGSDEEAAKNIQNFLRRLKRYRKKNNLEELKYICVTEKGKRGGRYHHHLVLNGGVDITDLVEIWGKGFCKISPLIFDTNGLLRKGVYMQKNPLCFKKKWNASKNLIQPVPEVRDQRLSQKKVREMANDTTDNKLYEKNYDGCFFSQAKILFNEFNGGTYLQIRMYRKDTEICNKQKANRQNK